MNLYQLVISLFIFSHVICPASAGAGVGSYSYDGDKPYSASVEESAQAWNAFKQVAADYPEFCETYDPSHLNGIFALKNSVRIEKEKMTCRALVSESFKPGQSLLLYAEKGLGDTIMWARYIEAFCKKFSALKVTVNVQPQLVCLKDMLRGCEDIVFTNGLKSEDERFTYCLSLFELPLVLNALLPTGEPYLNVDAGAVALARAHVDGCAKGRLKVGICFRGASGHKFNEARSIPLSAFKELISREKNICVFSLQIGDEQEQLAKNSLNVVDLSPHLKAITDTAAYIKALDVVITIDSMMGHLSGALGVSTIELLCTHPDFRWAIALHDSAPWYASQKLFRQAPRESWNDVMMRVVEEVNILAAAKK